MERDRPILWVSSQPIPPCCQQDSLGFTALMNAAFAGHTSILKALLDAAAAVDAVDAQLRTPLHAAAAKGNVAGISALVAAGAALQMEDADRKTPLDWATARGHTLAAQTLQVALDAAGQSKEEL